MCQHSVSRRGLFQRMALGAAAATPILELAWRRAAWAQAMAPGAATDLFEIQKVADRVYFAFARPQAVGNCNAAIFVNSTDVLVVDAHSKPSAAAGLIAQIKQITPKPVRYLVDTHFHWDHSQGNAGYRDAFGSDLKIVASGATKKLQEQFLQARLRESLDPHGHPFSSQPHIPVLLDAARQQLSAAGSAEQKAAIAERIRQLEAFQREMVIGTLPFLGDCFPREWPKTIDSVAKLDFDHVAGGHGGVQEGRQHMTGQRNYIEELATRVDAGKRAGKALNEIQSSMPVASIKSLQADGFGERVRAGRDEAAMQTALNTNIEHVFQRLGQG
jgi:glyoxylase-like metal-dependent hydrolase (beta-lactamase superfamily II)